VGFPLLFKTSCCFLVNFYQQTQLQKGSENRNLSPFGSFFHSVQPVGVLGEAWSKVPVFGSTKTFPLAQGTSVRIVVSDYFAVIKCDK
jgi:hypothetical protein